MIGYTETAPEGWKDTVERMKDHPEVSNPFALAHWMKNRGFKPHREGRPYDHAALIRRAKFESTKHGVKLEGMREAECHCGGTCAPCKAREANAATTSAYLTRDGVKACPKCDKPMAGETCAGCAKVIESNRIYSLSPLREASTQESAGQTPHVVLITGGPGNRMHGNFYPPEIVARDAHVFEGVKCFLNHPGAYDEKNRPEREAESVLGWFSNVQPLRADGNTTVVGDLNYMRHLDGSLTDAGTKARGYVESAIVYNRQYPQADKVLLGFSINAQGPTHRELSEALIQRYPQFAEALKAREWWNVSDGIESAQSVDLVTFPARGGRVIGLAEAEAYCDAECWQKRLAA